jgi:hypothetical protein
MWAAIEPKRNKTREDCALIRKSLAEIEAFRVSFPLVSQQNLRSEQNLLLAQDITKVHRPQPSHRHPSPEFVARGPFNESGITLTR